MHWGAFVFYAAECRSIFGGYVCSSWSVAGCYLFGFSGVGFAKRANASDHLWVGDDLYCSHRRPSKVKPCTRVFAGNWRWSWIVDEVGVERD